MDSRPSSIDYLVAVLLFAFGLALGMGFPDWDYRIPFLVHRSLLTHGIVVPLLLFAVLRKSSHPAPRYLAMGFCLASAVHLSFDLFPWSWWGYARIWVPFYGRTGQTFSWLWIAFGLVAAIYLSLLLIRHALEIALGAVGLATTFATHRLGERSGAALLALLVALGICLALPSPYKASMKHD